MSFAEPSGLVLWGRVVMWQGGVSSGKRHLVAGWTMVVHLGQERLLVACSIPSEAISVTAYAALIVVAAARPLTKD